MEEQRIVSIGIVGTNFVSDWMMAAINAHPFVRARCVYSRSAETGSAFAIKHGIPCVFTDYEKLLSSDVDAIYIASPNFLHYTHARLALEHNKHVLVEKALTLNAAQARELFALASQKKLVLMEAIRPVHDPFVDAVKGAYSQIGVIRRASFEHCQYSSRYDRFKSGTYMNAFDPSLGNAALMDIGVYCLHCMVTLLGVPDRITARSVFISGGFEAAGTVLCEYNGFIATVNYSKITSSICPNLIQGEDGSITFGIPTQPEFVTLKRRGEPDRTLYTTSDVQNMLLELTDFYECICARADAGFYKAGSLTVLDIMDEIRRQNRIDFGVAEDTAILG